MRAWARVALLGALLAGVAPPRAARAQVPPAGAPGAESLQLPTFTAVSSCAPFTVLVAPSPAGGGGANTSSVLFEAEPEVSPAVALQVADGVLYISPRADFASAAPIKLTARVPAAALTAVAARGGGTVAVASGFDVPALALSATGTSRIAARGVTAASLEVTAEGTSSVFVSGRLGSARVEQEGTSKVALDGAQGPVSGSLEGISKLFVNPADGG
ncbi:MAG: hypothetical protein J3K34DRAFT_291896 [Monoraphidium minutum]|nr:MAG: hypothetical protein J3K34DRAFT_291896 [Monoraphidium minutum]